MKSRNIDVITLIDELVHQGVCDETGGKDYISQIAETVPSAANVKDYAKIVSDKSQLRSLIDITEEISEAAYTEQDEVEKLIEARQNARKEKNWAEADRIRDLLKDMGIVLMDTKQGVQWKKA